MAPNENLADFFSTPQIGLDTLPPAQPTQRTTTAPQPRPTGGADLSKAPKWADVAARPEFQALTPDKQSEAKAAYFDYWIAPNAGAQAQNLRQQFLTAEDAAPFATPQPAKPTTNSEPGIVSDVGNLFGMGINATAQNVRELVGRIPGVGRTIVDRLDAIDKWATGKNSDELLKGNVKAAQERLTPEMQTAGDRKWWDSEKGTFGDAWTDPRSYVSGIVQSLPEQALTMIPAMRLAKGIYASKIAAGVAPQVASAAAARAATMAGAVSEGSLAGAASSREVRDKILAMKPEQMQASEAVQALVSQGMTFEQAREQIANDAATQAFITSGVATGAFGGFGDRMLAKAMTEGIGKNVVGRVFKGVVGEGVLEEFPQETLGAVAENAALRRADPRVSLTDDVLNRGLGGLATGGIQGGAMAGVLGRNAGTTGVPAMATLDQPTTANVTPDGRLEADGTDYRLEGDAPVVSALMQAGIQPTGVPDAGVVESAPTAEPMAQPVAPTPTAEPTPTPPANVHPTQAAADAIVRQIAEQAGIPLETVLPTPAVPVTQDEPTAESQPLPMSFPEPTGADVETTPEAVPDQDVIEFANSRYRQLRAKRDGDTRPVMTDNGIEAGDVPGVPLSPQEAREMAALESSRGDARALRTFYGFDQAQAQQGASAMVEPQPQADQPAAQAATDRGDGLDLSMRTDDELRQQMRNAGSRGVQRVIAEELQRRRVAAMNQGATLPQPEVNDNPQGGGLPTFNAKDDYTQNDGAQDDDIAALETLIDAANRRAVDAGQARSARGVHPFRRVQMPDGDGLGAIASAFGKRVVGFEAASPVLGKEFAGFNGVTWPAGAGNAIFLNRDADRPHLAILGHEMAHQMAKTRPDLYARMVEAIRPYVRAKGYGTQFATSSVARNSYPEGTTAERRDNAIREEFIGEVLSDGFMDPDFWRALGASNKQLLAQVQAFVSRLIQKAARAVSYEPKTARYLTDYRRVMEIAGAVMAEYGMDQQRMSAAAGVEVAFNRGEDKDDQDAKTLGELTAGSRRNQSPRAQREAISQEFGDAAFTRFNWLHNSVGTQYHKAQISPEFRRVFDTANAMEAAGTLVAVRTAELAPSVLPKALNLVTAARQLVQGRKAAKEMQAATSAVLEGTTLGKTVLDGKVWSDDELRQRFKLSDQGIALYRQMRASIDAAVFEVAAAEIYALSALYVKQSERRAIRELFIDDPAAGVEKLSQSLDAMIAVTRKAVAFKQRTGPADQVASFEEMLRDQEDTRRRVDEVVGFAKTLARVGYAPLMRFGRYTVTVQEKDPATGTLARDDDGKPVPPLYFERFETEAEARDAYFNQGARFAGMSDRIRITADTVNEDEHKLYAGVSPEVVALFAEKVGNKAFEQLLTKVAVSDQSILKRQLNRKNVPGYSREYDRVLAKFVTSSGRWAASKYYMSDLRKSVKHIRQRDVQAQAQKLLEYVTDQKADSGQDLASGVSSLAFTWFLGGPTNIASAFVNFLQVGTLLPQHLVKTTSTAKASAAIAKAYPAALGLRELPADLRSALKKAEQEGKVDAQEVHHLYNIGIQGIQAVVTDYISRVPGGDKASRALLAARYRLQAAGVLWGAMFGAVESLNRRVTFISAWNVAQAENLKDPFAYAIKAVDETQGIYTKANRPNLSRNALGRSVLTFKMVPTMWVEIMVRNLKYGGKPGYYAAALQLATMILLAGAAGLPFEDDLIDVIDTVAQKMGYNWNTKQQRERWAKETFGQLWGEAVISGMSAFLPVDLAGRLGVSNLVPATGLLKKSNEGRRERDVAELFGVGGSFAVMGIDAYDAANAGRMDRAMLAMAPTSVRNLAMGAEMATTGAARDLATGKKKADATPAEGVFKAFGFNPQSLAQSGQARFYESQSIAMARVTSKEIGDKWAEGVATKNQALVDQAVEDQREWNRKNPDYPIYIIGRPSFGKVRAFMQDADTRLLRSAPKRWRGTVNRNLGLDDLDDE